MRRTKAAHLYHLREASHEIFDMRRNIDSQAGRELKLYIDNDATLYRQRMVPIQKNLVRKKIAGTYTSAKAPKAWSYLVSDGAKKYAKEFANPRQWSMLFPPETRRKVEKAYAQEFEAQWKAGALDYLIEELKPKKFAHLSVEDIRRNRKRKKKSTRASGTRIRKRIVRRNAIPSRGKVIARDTTLELEVREVPLDEPRGVWAEDGVYDPAAFAVIKGGKIIDVHEGSRTVSKRLALEAFEQLKNPRKRTKKNSRTSTRPRITDRNLNRVVAAYQKTARGVSRLKASGRAGRTYTRGDIEKADALVLDESTEPAPPSGRGRRGYPGRTSFRAYVVRGGRWMRSAEGKTPAVAAKTALGPTGAVRKKATRKSTKKNARAKKPKLKLISKDRYRASAAERRRYGGATVTEFWVELDGQLVFGDGGRAMVITGYGKTPGERKTFAKKLAEERLATRNRRRPTREKTSGQLAAEFMRYGD